MPPIITLCTDFGIVDGYVGAMKGVILGLAPQAQIVDITHQVAPQDIRAAAFALYTTYSYFPQGTIHLVVVDPGVGSERRILAARTPHHMFVAPDNGVLGYVLSQDEPIEVVALSNPSYWRDAVSHTFHGRDIMAPVAAHMARGVSIQQLGRPIGDWVRMDLPQPQRRADGAMVGEVLSIDHFGNVITTIPAAWLAGRTAWRVVLGSLHIMGLSSSYAAADPGAALALIGSHGYLEVAIREGSAALSAPARIGDPAVVAQL